jgi:2-dehydro-3-deoxyphosphogluconate aldolase/(4S)-4-hydroxy-2-oxoglutarate aldolase
MGTRTIQCAPLVGERGHPEAGRGNPAARLTNGSPAQQPDHVTRRKDIRMEPLALARLREQRLIAVIRAPSPEAALGAARAVVAGGIGLVEITFTVPDATRVMAALADEPGLTLGAGTVLDAAQARAALAAGARFLIAPNLSLEVAAEAARAGVLFCPGAYTTTEILAARAAGAHVVKVYPVGVAGGPAYIRIIRDPLPDVPMLAAGGTTLDNVVPFLEAGCVGVGLGAALADPALAAAGRFDEITHRARAFVERVAGARPAGA